jgi:hypothetical protein
MLLDLRVVLAAVLATVLLLTAGFSLIAGVRSPLKPSIGFSIGGPPEARALNAPPSASAQPRQLPVRNRATEEIAPVIEKPVNPTAETPPAKNNANIILHEQSTLTDVDKALDKPAGKTDKAGKSTAPGQPKTAAKAKKKVRTVVTPAPAKPAFSFGQ